MILFGCGKPLLPAQTLRVMKLTCVLLTAFFLQVSASGISQQITYSGKDVPLEKVFSIIKKQTGYVFFYRTDDISGALPVTVDFHNTPLETVLNELFSHQPLTWSIKGSTIVVTVKVKEALSPPGPVSALSASPPGEVHGRITNAQGEPLANANVIIMRIKTGTITNAKGEFHLKNVMPDDIIDITYVGFKTIRIKPGSQTDLSLVMEQATNELDKVVIQAYGTTSRRLATGNIGTVTAVEIERQPVMNPMLALQGKIAGLDVSQTSGYASAPVKIELRGRSAINNAFTSDPLYIIDGVPLTVSEIGGKSNYNIGSTGFIQTGTGFNGPANGQSPFFSINPADIESIEVLKDADATAIYGSRGANGVILITTKTGKPGKTKFDLHVHEGIEKVTRFYKLLNTPQYLMMRREAFKNDGVDPDPGSAYDLLSWDTTRYTDWQKTLYGGTGRSTDAQGSLSGGDNRTNFRVGAGYSRMVDITTASGSDQRVSLSFNVAHKSLDRRFEISLTGSYSSTRSNMVYLGGSIIIAPNAPAIYDSAGNLNYAGWGGKDLNESGRSAYPFAALKQPYSSRTDFLNSSLRLSYRLITGLSVSLNLGYNNAQANQQGYRTIASQDPLTNPRGGSTFGFNNNKNFLIEPQVDYTVLLGRGKLTALVGASGQKNNVYGLSVAGQGYTSDDLLGAISNATRIISSDRSGEYKYAALFGRVNYSFENKYILNLSARRDGSSRFGSGKQYGNFASAGAAWIFSEGKFIQKSLSFLSFGKLRASYGTSGSDAIGDYKYLTRWSANGTLPYGAVPSLVPTQHANPDFRWQLNKKLEAAIDLGFLKDRINLSVAYYRNRCGNQLISFPVPTLSGFAEVAANSPALVENSGWEFLLNANIIEHDQFRFSINFNTSFNNNKLVAYPNFELSPYVGQLIVGQPLNIVQLLHYTGVDPQTGQYTFYDKNHDGQVTVDYSGKEDDRYIYNLSPKFFGGLGINLGLSQWQFNLFFNIKKQTGVNATNQGDLPGVLNNQPVGVLKRWQNIGDLAPVARFTTQSSQSDDYYKGLSDGGYTDASYIRLSNASISYNIPRKLLSKTGIEGCSIYLHANNLFIITGYKGIDPETRNFGGLPPSRIIVGGIAVNF